MTEPRSLVARLLAAPDIARVVPQLPPRVLNQIIDRCGLEACADLVMLATPRQLQRVLDVDLWRAPVPGADETFDGDRFVHWVEVLLDAGPAAAADRIAAMDLELVAGGIADHARVFDGGAVSAYISLEGEVMDHYVRRGPDVREIGGFVLEPRRSSAFGTIVELLAALHGERPALFHRLMRRCVAVSDGEHERDGCDALLEDREQHLADLAADRETRRDREGFVAPAHARAFLQAARSLALSGPAPAADPIAHAYLRDVRAEVGGRAAEGGAEDRERRAEDRVEDGTEVGGRDAEDAIAAVMELLVDAGVVAAPRGLLAAGAPEEDRLARVHQVVESHFAASEELAFLTNVVLSGPAIQGRPFTPQEAGDAVLATCNLGLENLPAGWDADDPIVAFQTGWAVLHRDVCRHAARAVMRVLDDIRLSDADAQWSLETLRRELMRHLSNGEPWRARQALDAILMLDPPAWAVLRAFLDEYPALHVSLTPAGRGALTLDPDRVTFIATTDEIGVAWEWLASLASVLSG
jgi:hypothetical protein